MAQKIITDFCHLHNHNEYSLLDGLGKAEAWAKQAKAMGFTHLGLANHGNVDGAIKFQNACKAEGILPVIGCELYIVQDLAIKEKGEKRRHIVVYVRNNNGWKNLLKMLTISNLEGMYRRPRVDVDTLLEHCGGLVITTGCANTFLNDSWGTGLITKLMAKTKVFLEVMPHMIEEQKKVNNLMLTMSGGLGLPLIATQDCHYPTKEGAKHQEVLLAIQRKVKWNDPKRWKFDIDDLYLKDKNEMLQAFKEQGILSESVCKNALENTMSVARMCEGFTIEQQKVSLPRVPGYEEVDETVLMKSIIKEGYHKRIVGKQKKDLAKYRARLTEEFNLICNLGFQRYFLIVWELLNWCRNNDVMVGPGRGSVGGSLVAYCMFITDVDPVEHDLIFSRFISPARIDLPDIDMDFEDIKRDQIRKHLEDCYGENNVVSVTTFMTLKGRSALRDVARVFDVPNSDIDPAAKAIVVRSGGDFRSDFSIEDALEAFEDGIKFKKKYPEVASIAMALEGQVRGCLSGDCRVQLKNSTGGVKTKKIRKLFEEGYRGQIKAYDFESGRLYFDDVVDIFESGVNDLYKLTAGENRAITLTKDHRLLTKFGWKAALDIEVGEFVAVNGKFVKNMVPWNKGTKGAQIAWNKGLTKDDHPAMAESSNRMKNRNPMHSEEIKQRVSHKLRKHGLYSSIIPDYKLSNPVCELCRDRKAEEIHHIDKNPKNNDESNLKHLCTACHHEVHWRTNKDKYPDGINQLSSSQTIKWSKVKSIEYCGKEMTYDIEMRSRNHNFVCNKFIAHNCGTHAAGMCISMEDLRKGNRCAIDKRKGVKLCNWGKEDAEYMGMMKLDVLGLSALTVLNETKKMVKENHGIDIVFDDIPLDDKKVYSEINSGYTVGAFQIGSMGLSRFCRELGVTCFTDLVNATSLWRPGTLRSGMTAEFVLRKKGKSKWKSLHPALNAITAETYGIILYQEQIMRFMYELAGLPWRTCDVIRKVISKSQGDDLFLSFKDKFVEGCQKKGTLNKETAAKVWNELSSFGSYGFNKSHAVEYSVITYWDMWCKTYYPDEFMACSLTYGSSEKRAEYMTEARRMGLTIHLPKISYSKSKEWKAKENNLYAPFMEMKGVGEKTALLIENLGKDSGFCDIGGKTKKPNKSVMKNLRRIHAFDDTIVSEEEADALEELFDFDISTDPMRSVRGIKELIDKDKGIVSLKDVDFSRSDNKLSLHFGKLETVRFGYKTKVLKEKKAGIKGGVADIAQSMGGVYGFLKDESESCMLIFSRELYEGRKDDVEHSEGQWIAVKASHPSKNSQLMGYRMADENDLKTCSQNLKDFDLDLVKSSNITRLLDTRECEKCPLHETRKNSIIPSVGKHNLMILAGKPDKTDNENGSLFRSGSVGRILWDSLDDEDLRPNDFHVTSVVKCCAGEKKNPPKTCVNACSNIWLKNEIKEVKPIVILALGNEPIQFFDGVEGGISTLTGTTKWYPKYNAWVCYCITPASVLYSDVNREIFEQGIKNFANTLENIGFYG